jgi:hypothetical protein
MQADSCKRRSHKVSDAVYDLFGTDTDDDHDDVLLDSDEDVTQSSLSNFFFGDTRGRLQNVSQLTNQQLEDTTPHVSLPVLPPSPAARAGNVEFSDSEANSDEDCGNIVGSRCASSLKTFHRYILGDSEDEDEDSWKKLSSRRLKLAVYDLFGTDTDDDHDDVRVDSDEDVTQSYQATSSSRLSDFFFDDTFHSYILEDTADEYEDTWDENEDTEDDTGDQDEDTGDQDEDTENEDEANIGNGPHSNYIHPTTTSTHDTEISYFHKSTAKALRWLGGWWTDVACKDDALGLALAVLKCCGVLKSSTGSHGVSILDDSAASSNSEVRHSSKDSRRRRSPCVYDLLSLFALRNALTCIALMGHLKQGVSSLIDRAKTIAKHAPSDALCAYAYEDISSMNISFSTAINKLFIQRKMLSPKKCARQFESYRGDASHSAIWIAIKLNHRQAATAICRSFVHFAYTVLSQPVDSGDKEGPSVLFSLAGMNAYEITREMLRAMASSSVPDTNGTVMHPPVMLMCLMCYTCRHSAE